LSEANEPRPRANPDHGNAVVWETLLTRTVGFIGLLFWELHVLALLAVLPRVS